MPKNAKKSSKSESKGLLAKGKTPMPARRFKKDDKVMIISGKEKGKYGSFLRYVKNGRALVAGLNLSIRHQKDRGDPNNPAGKVKKESPIHVSNLSAACPHCASPTRTKTEVALTEEDGVKKKIKTVKCHRCGEVLYVKK
jgi:large subunit ribosomal protein L24